MGTSSSDTVGFSALYLVLNAAKASGVNIDAICEAAKKSALYGEQRPASSANHTGPIHDLISEVLEEVNGN